MRNKLKKVFCGALASVLAAASHGAFAANVGDIAGKVLSTDIVTYIDGIQVPSFNIAGRTAVVAENLNAKGLSFGVNYDNTTRTLTIAGSDIFGTGGRDYFHFEGSTSSQPVGTEIMDVLYTDITANYEGAVLESFNIGGFTCVYADDLAKLCGTYEWSEEARTVNVYRESTQPLSSVTRKDTVRVLSAEESVITKDETFDRWGTPAASHLIRNDDGTYSAVEISEHINIEMYDSEFNHLSSFAIKKELPIFGALYVGKDFNYIAFGQENLLDDNSREVIKIVIYDKSFVKISEVSVNNCKTAIPFDASAGEMHEDDRYLVLHTSRSQYRDENGVRPQTQLTVIIDKSTWTVSNMLGKFQHNHTSHALREFVKIDNGRLITANYSDAAPIRGAFLQELDFSGKVLKTQSIFNVGGALAANCTGAMIGGFEVSDSGYLVSMSTIDHSLASGYSSINIEGIDRENRDIYLLWTDKSTWELRHTCLARYTGVELTGSVPYLVKLSDGNFMVLWQRFSDYSNESDTFCYAFVDGNGNQIGETVAARGRLSESCKPIESDGKVVWYVNTENGREFYAADADSTKAIKPVETEEPVGPVEPTLPEITIPANPEEPEIILPVEPEPPAEIMDNEENNQEDAREEKEDKITEVDGI